MKHEPATLRKRVRDLHAEEEREKAFAATLPYGEERDEHRMRGERLSDEAWSLEEGSDLDHTPSGLWQTR
jgi:hypothetical protein